MDVKKSFQIFKRDVLRLLRNPVAMVITIGVCIIPSLYAWYNIAANWDPYGSTAGVKIAVANEDEGTSNELVGELNAGEQTMDELKKNHDLGWVFTDADEAEEGVRRGDYYAAIVIPRNFSEKLTSMLTGDFEQPKISYYVNEKKNAIAPKVTDTGAETIEEQINETFVSTVSKTLVAQAKELGVDLDAQAATTQSGLLAHIRSSKDAVAEVRESLGGMDETIAATKKAVGTAQGTLTQLSGQVPALTTALGQADSLMGTTRAAARDFSTALSTALTGGATQLGAASAKANAAVGTVSGVVAEAKLKADISLSNLQSIIDTNTKVIELLVELNESGHITGKLDRLIAGLQEQNATMQGLKDGLQAQSDAVGQDVNAVEGAVLLACFVAFIAHAVITGLREGDSGREDLDPEQQLDPHELEDEDADADEPRGTLVSLALILVGIAFLKIGADYVVNNSVDLATGLGISERIIGITVIALGPCLPELVTSVVAAFRGNTDIAVGNVVGSNITNVLMVMGVPALFSPIAYDASYNFDFALLSIFSIVLVGFAFVGTKHAMTRREGVAFVFLYVVYIVLSMMM